MQKYCIHTSALLDGWHDLPKDNFGVWDKIEQLIEEKRLITPYYVLNEIKRRDDELYHWCKNTNIDCNPTEKTTRILKEVLKEFPDFTPKKSQKADWSDPWVISMSIEHNCVIISHQNKKMKNENKCYIPDICDERNIECYSILDLIKAENWRFK